MVLAKKSIIEEKCDSLVISLGHQFNVVIAGKGYATKLLHHFVIKLFCQVLSCLTHVVVISKNEILINGSHSSFDLKQKYVLSVEQK